MSEALNVTKAAFGGLREVTTAPLWQYDYGQILQITGLDLPQAFEVHFSNSRKSGETVTQIGADNQVTIPDMYLTSGADIYCFIFLHDGLTDGETEYVIKIPVRERPEPSDIEPTPEQQDAITEAIAALNVAVTQTGEDVISADASARAAAQSATDAQTAAQSAQGSATSASGSATTASTAATTASTKASEAATSAANAASAKTAAETAATNAEAAQRASERAQAFAQFAAQTATTKASEASTSATSASGSASAASASASQASESATNAATAKTAAEAAQTAAETAAATFETDTTLTVSGKAADAKATGDAVNDLKSDLIDLGTNGNTVVPATFNWQNGYITDSGVIGASTASQYAVLTLTVGQTIVVGTRNTYTTVLSSTESDSLSIGDSVTIIYKTGGNDEYTEFSYTAKETIKIVVCVRKAEFYVNIKEPSLIKTVSERVDYLESGIAPITKALTWASGWIGVDGKINSSTASQYTLVQLNRGETVKVGTANSSTCIIGYDTRSSVSVGDKISTIIKTGSIDAGYIEHTFTAQYTINVVICVKKKDYAISFYKMSNLGICEEKTAEILDVTNKNYYEKTVAENGSFASSGLTYGTSNRIRTALIPFSARTRIVIENGSLHHACGMWQDVVDSSHIKRNDGSFNTKDETIVTAYSGYLVVVFRNPSNASVSPSDYDGTIKVYPPSFCNLEETLKNLNSARHIPRNAGVPLTILHISDIHYSPITLNQIVEQAKYYGNNVDDMICTGDLVQNQYTSITAWWNEKVLTCIGNHDTAGYVNDNFSWTALSMADRDAYYIAPFESNWGIIHTSGTSYYYKDYAESKVRLIVMDAMLYNDNGSEATAQTTWLTNLLADAITNELHVIIAIHSPHGGAKPVNCSFTELGATNMPTFSDCNTPQSVIDTVATAINNGLHFIGYICGHTHRDTIWDAEDDGSQLMFSIICAMNSPANTDLYRGANNNAYNLVTIDTVNTLVKIVRGGGADIDNAMRPRKAICFNYSTGEKLGEVL